MSNQTENSTEKSLEVVSETNRFAVYTVNVTQSFAEPAGKDLAAASAVALPAAPAAESPAPLRRAGFSGKIFKWRNAIAAAAIFVVGVLHFAFQLSFQREVSENRPPLAPPPVNEAATEILLPKKPAVVAPLVTGAAQPGAEAPAAEPSRRSPVAPKPRRVEAAPEPAAAPVRPVLRRREALETKAERLRRAERILTGI